MRTQAFQFYPLAGMDQRWRPPENTAAIVRDMEKVGAESWREAGGIRQIVNDTGGGNPFDGEGGIQSLHWFAQHNGAKQWLIWETSGGALRYFNGSKATPWDDMLDQDGNAWDGTVRSRQTQRTPWQRSQSQAFGNRLYIVNGLDEPVVFNGRYTERAGFTSAPPAPVASVLDEDENWTTGLSDQGVGRFASTLTETVECAYRYVVTFLNERGQESPPSQPSEMVLMDNGDGVSERSGGTGARSYVYVQLPTGDSTVVARRVYRTRNILNSDGEPLDLGFGAAFYFLREFQDNMVTSFEDFSPDSGLGSLLDPLDYGPWPLSVKFACVFKNTMFLAGSQDNTVRYSRPLFPEVIPEDNVIDISDGHLGPITGMYATQDALVVFKSGGIYLIRGDARNGFFSQTLTRDIGCIAPNSICDVPGVGLAFLGADGVYVMAGADNQPTFQSIVNISQNIQKLVGRINRSAAIGAAGAVYHRAKEYWLAVPTLGSDKNDLILVFHYESGDWSYRENIPAAVLVESRDHRGYMFIGSHEPTDKPGVLVYSHGWPDRFNGDEIEPYYRSCDIPFGGIFSTIQPKYAMVYAVAHGNNDMQVNYIVNGDIDAVRDAVQAADQQDPNKRFPVYGEAIWGTDRWARLRPTVVRFDISVTDVGPCRELSLTIEPETQRIQIIGFDIEAAVGDQRLIKPLSTMLVPDKG